MLNAMVSKNIWRTKMLNVRSQLGPDKANQLNREISKNIQFVLAEGGGLGQPKPIWATYKSFKWEADPSQAVFESTPHIRWSYPRVSDGAQSIMEFFVPNEKDALWLKNAWGLWEPDPRTAEKVEVQDLKGVLVPGLAFSKNGQRLGYGKGYYDHSLAHFSGLKVGVAFSVQVTDENLPQNESDVVMDMIVTDSEIIKVRRE